MTTIAQAPPTVKPHAIVGVKHFARQLAIAGKVAPKRGYRPILGFVRLIADPEQGATIEATDLEIGIRLRVLGVRCESRAAMLLPPAGASKLLKSACSEDVTLTDRGGRAPTL
jgi:DNA polymerase III sliding clamp (beta) subunit (PCNA family)